MLSNLDLSKTCPWLQLQMKRNVDVSREIRRRIKEEISSIKTQLLAVFDSIIWDVNE